MLLDITADLLYNLTRGVFLAIVMTLKGLCQARAQEVRRARGEPGTTRYPMRVSVRLDNRTWTDIETMRRGLADDLTTSEFVRILLEWVTFWQPLQARMLQAQRDEREDY